jgi:dTDP-4-amino-4,6-dideoxygalactose transaminase
MDEMQAAVLLAKLPYLDLYIEQRLNLVTLYDNILGRYTEGDFHYAYCVDGSEELKQHMIKNGVECAFYYTPEFTALPLYPDLTEKEVYQICRIYNDFSNNR